MSLTPYTGNWSPAEAAHLLRRATFGFSYGQLQEAANLGLGRLLDRLLEEQELPEPPVSNGNRHEPTPAGQTWVDQPYASGDDLDGSVVFRIFNLSNWQGRLMLTEGMHIRETMQLFWHNHFAINFGQEPKFLYRYLDTMRRNAIGDYRQMVKDITVDPLMLYFLNGHDSSVIAPNENYARELLELFTIGKGPQAGPEDYTTYTEQDVREMARVLTGWRYYGFHDNQTGAFGSEFIPRRHDTRPARLSHRFGNAAINSTGENAYAELVDFILERDEVARFMVRNLYRWFVYYDITPEIEAEVIEPLAAIFRESDYQLKPVLRALLGSDHFFAIRQRGPMIKHPYDFVMGLLKAFEMPTEGGNLRQTEQLSAALASGTQDMGMVYFTPPNVAGWKAFYQEPLYYRVWINSSTLAIRQEYVKSLLETGIEVRGQGTQQARLLPLIEQFPDPANLPSLLAELNLFLLPRPLTTEQVAFLWELVIPGLPDNQWTTEYSDYLASPNDETIVAALETKLRRTVVAMLNMPEFQLT